MNRILSAALVALAVAGCQAAPKTAQKPPAPAGSSSGANAVPAAAPKAIGITDQKWVWECPNCGMDYDGAGTCSMDGATLVQMQVSYICPADNKPVEHAGKCPRCAANARIEKVAVAGSAVGR